MIAFITTIFKTSFLSKIVATPKTGFRCRPQIKKLVLNQLLTFLY